MMMSFHLFIAVNVIELTNLKLKANIIVKNVTNVTKEIKMIFFIVNNAIIALKKIIIYIFVKYALEHGKK